MTYDDALPNGPPLKLSRFLGDYYEALDHSADLAISQSARRVEETSWGTAVLARTTTADKKDDTALEKAMKSKAWIEDVLFHLLAQDRTCSVIVALAAEYTGRKKEEITLDMLQVHSSQAAPPQGSTLIDVGGGGIFERSDNVSASQSHGDSGSDEDADHESCSDTQWK